ncbi:MAG: hypothetical protein ACI4EA_04120 [Candidatus Ornithomonoglobus sp.]
MSTWSRKHSTQSLLIGGLTFLLIFIFIRCDRDNEEDTANIPTATPTVTAVATPTPLPVEMPANGEILKSPSAELVAPLKVTAKGVDGSNKINYYVYLKSDDGDSEKDISFFVRSLQTAEIKVPLGIYQLYYCAGNNWFGRELKFGKETAYYKYNDLLTFQEEEYWISGNSLTLYNNNNESGYDLTCRSIGKYNFPE